METLLQSLNLKSFQSFYEDEIKMKVFSSFFSLWILFSDIGGIITNDDDDDPVSKTVWNKASSSSSKLLPSCLFWCTYKQAEFLSRLNSKELLLLSQDRNSSEKTSHFHYHFPLIWIRKITQDLRCFMNALKSPYNLPQKNYLSTFMTGVPE